MGAGRGPPGPSREGTGRERRGEENAGLPLCPRDPQARASLAPPWEEAGIAGTTENRVLTPTTPGRDVCLDHPLNERMCLGFLSGRPLVPTTALGDRDPQPPWQKGKLRQRRSPPLPLTGAPWPSPHEPTFRLKPLWFCCSRLSWTQNPCLVEVFQSMPGPPAAPAARLTSPPIRRRPCPSGLHALWPPPHLPTPVSLFLTIDFPSHLPSLNPSLNHHGCSCLCLLAPPAWALAPRE